MSKLPKLHLPFALALPVLCALAQFAQVTPASAQTTASVTLTLMAGSKTQGNLTGVKWSGGTLTIEGTKSDGSTFRCHLKSTNHELLLRLQERMMDAKTKTSAICSSSTASTTQVTVDLANQTSMNYFSLTLMR